MPKLAKPEPAFVYSLSQFTSATIYGRGQVELRRGPVSFHLTDPEAARLREAVEHFAGERVGARLSARPDDSTDRPY